MVIEWSSLLWFHVQFNPLHQLYIRNYIILIDMHAYFWPISTRPHFSSKINLPDLNITTRPHIANKKAVIVVTFMTIPNVLLGRYWHSNVLIVRTNCSNICRMMETFIPRRSLPTVFLREFFTRLQLFMLLFVLCSAFKIAYPSS